jgi:hypothetical protein
MGVQYTYRVNVRISLTNLARRAAGIYDSCPELSDLPWQCYNALPHGDLVGKQGIYKLVPDSVNVKLFFSHLQIELHPRT